MDASRLHAAVDADVILEEQCASRLWPPWVRARAITGHLKLTWKCNNPATTSGTVYIIKRRVGSTGAWAQAGIASSRSFTDLDVPTAAVVQYQITAQRSNTNSLPSQPVSVAFGHGVDGEAFVKSVKIAA